MEVADYTAVDYTVTDYIVVAVPAVDYTAVLVADCTVDFVLV